MDLKINAWSAPNDYGQILQFSTGGACCDLGERVPGLWTEKNGNVVIVSFDSVRQLVYDFKLGDWYNLTLSKRQEQVSLNEEFTEFLLHLTITSSRVNG